MKTLIAYSSKYGCTERCARKLLSLLPGDVELANIQEDQAIDLTGYDQVILGGSIYAGQASKKVRDFCRKNVQALEAKRIGLFLCCFDQGENARQYMERTFPAGLIDRAIAAAFFGWEIHWESMSSFERWIVKKISGIQSEVSKIDEAQILQFVIKMQR